MTDSRPYDLRADHLLDPSDWVARWVAPVEAGDLAPRQRPAYAL